MKKDEVNPRKTKKTLYTISQQVTRKEGTFTSLTARRILEQELLVIVIDHESADELEPTRRSGGCIDDCRACALDFSSVVVVDAVAGQSLHREEQRIDDDEAKSDSATIHNSCLTEIERWSSTLSPLGGNCVANRHSTDSFRFLRSFGERSSMSFGVTCTLDDNREYFRRDSIWKSISIAEGRRGATFGLLIGSFDQPNSYRGRRVTG